jgi:hypothetical protein
MPIHETPVPTGAVSAIRTVATAAALLAASACDSSPKNAAASLDVAWDTLPSGAAHAVYASFPVFPFTTGVDLRIGGAGADGPTAFGDVRGIEVGPDGSILVLDAKASELRAFDPAGAYVGTLLDKRAGTGEMGSANGLRVDTLGVIWVNDPGRGRVIRLRAGEATSYPLATSGVGAVWEGGITHDGRAGMVERQPRRNVRPARRDAGGDDAGATAAADPPLAPQSRSGRPAATDSVALGIESTEVAIYPMVMTPVPFAGRAAQRLRPGGRAVDRFLGHVSRDQALADGRHPAHRRAPRNRARRLFAGARRRDREGHRSPGRGSPAGRRRRRGSDATDWEAAVGNTEAGCC